MKKTAKNCVPEYVAVLCEQIVKGHEKRKKDYESKRTDIIYSHSSGFDEAVGASRGVGHISNSCATKAERLEQLEDSLNAQFLRAVEQSLVSLGDDVPRDSREKLRKAVLLNCESGREFPFEILGIDEFSRRDFYRRRKRFILGVGAALGLTE